MSSPHRRRAPRPLRRTLLLLLLLLAGCSAGNPSEGAAPAAAPPAPSKALGSFSPIRGTDYLVAPIVQSTAARETSGFSLSSSGYTPATTHNLVFLNEQDETIRQLLPTNDQVLVFQNSFPTPREEKLETPPIAWFLYGIVAADSNGDGRLDQEDLQTLAVSDAGSQGYTALLTDVEAIRGTTLSDPTTLLVMLRQGGSYQLARIDLPARTVADLTPFPPLGSDVE